MEQSTFKAILLQVLSVIQYQNNKEKFAEEFEMLNRLDAVAAVIDDYPSEIQEKIKQVRTPEALEQLIPLAAYQAAYTQVSHKALESFIVAIAPTSSPVQKEKIAQLVLQS